jgi:DNA-binding protein
MIDQSMLRLSAQRALLGRIHSEMRLVKIKAVGTEITLSVIVASQVINRLRADVSEAATEIISDFSQATRIDEHFEISGGPISVENVLTEGWIFRRAE